MDCILRSEFCLSGTHTLSDSCPTLSLSKGSLTPFMFTPEPQSRTLVHSSCLELCPLQYLHPMSPLRIDMHSYPTSYQVDGTPSEFPIFVWKFPTLVQMVHMLLWKSFRCSIKVVCLRCRDSSLYGRIQTISQDLILDLLQRSDFRNFRVFVHLTYFTHFAFSCTLHCHTFHISDTSCFRTSHILHTFRNPTQFAFCALTYLMHFAFLHSCVFHILTRTTVHLPRICRIPFACPALILQGPYFTLFHLHYIIYVFTFPFMFTYLIMCLYYITLVHLALPTWLQALGTCLAC
jgi:hypothetical protein